MIYQYPLQWPPGFPRTKYPARSRFDTPEERVKRNLERELELLDAANIVVTTNVELRRDGKPYAGQRVEYQGVAIHFVRSGRQQAIACDRWDSVRDNLQAVSKTIEALRGIDRWGTGEMVDAAFAGFTAIPANASSGTPVQPKRSWWEVLEISPSASSEIVEAAFKAKRRSTHPDSGGNEDAFNEVQEAYKEAQANVTR